MKNRIKISFVVFAFSLVSNAFASNCIENAADGFPCSKVNLMSKMALSESGISAKSGNDIWGWTDSETGKEYALMGLSSKLSIVDVTDSSAPIHVADIPTQTVGSTWRDMKVYQDHVFIVSEARNHGMQVVDLTRLRDLDVDKIKATGAITMDIDAHYDGFGTCHNIFINEETGYAYAVGTNNCDQGAHVVNISDPKKPRFATCLDRSVYKPGKLETGTDSKKQLSFHSLLDPGDVYTHDIQCVVYNGPDKDYLGREICVASNDNTMNVVDVTDKAKPMQTAEVTYEGYGFAHQGWLTEDHRYFFLGDELDEVRYRHKTKTYVFDLEDLDNPKLVTTMMHDTDSIDHNMYIKGDYLFQANYTAGLRIFKLEDIAMGKIPLVGYFDIFPEDDRPEFLGAWSVYPYFESGTVVISGIDGNLYVVKPSFD